MNLHVKYHNNKISYTLLLIILIISLTQSQGQIPTVQTNPNPTPIHHTQTSIPLNPTNPTNQQIPQVTSTVLNNKIQTNEVIKIQQLNELPKVQTLQEGRIKLQAQIKKIQQQTSQPIPPISSTAGQPSQAVIIKMDNPNANPHGNPHMNTNTNTEQQTHTQTQNQNTNTANIPRVESQQQIEHPKVGNQGETINFQGNQDTKQFAINLDPLRDNIIQKQQAQIDKQTREKEQNKLHPWISSQMQLISQANQVKTHQIFASVLNIDQQIEFKWNPTQMKAGPLKFVVEVFDFNRGDLLFMDNPQEDDFVQISVMPDHSYSYVVLGKVYLKKAFTINFFSDFTLIKLINHYDQRILVQISLQATKFIPQKALDDDDLKIPAQKIESILQQLQQTQKKRQKTFREQWSFKDRQQHHQSQMLILTGVQLFVILGTAIVQMYCIKNLFDNRLIV